MIAEDRAQNIRMIRDSAAAVAPREGDLRRVRALRFQQPGFDPAIWREMCDMGWVGLRVPEADGGSGLGMGEFCALAEELGAGLVPEPLIPCAMAARVMQGEDLRSLLSGERVVSPAWQEQLNTLDPLGETTLHEGRVTGSKVFVPMAAGAHAFLVTTGSGLALVPSDASGVSLTIEQTQDGGHFGTLILEGAPAIAVSGGLAQAIEEAALATAAYLLGVMDRAFEMTLEYLKTRRQFGRPIGSFQALQHRASDLKLQVALTRASVESAAATLDADAPEPVCRAAVSRAKARAAEASMLVTRQAIQLHGAIGYTDEYDVGLFLRKAMVLANMYGSAALHRSRFAQLSPEQDDD
jgi:alkylation response protein AidB-like acyl-CoA dehydrogenase